VRLGKRQQKRLYRIFLAIVVAGVAFYLNRVSTPPPEVLGTLAPGYYRVMSFEDGDTITVDMSGQRERIRMIGVDTPETQDPRKPVQCFGKAASEFTKNLIGNHPVRLEADSLNSNRDRYDRLLRYVYLPDGRLVQAEIIKQGYGFAYVSFPFSKAEEFANYQKEAREAGRGLWTSCNAEPNEYGGFTSNPEQ
jgi:micrococcal nuclease